MANTLCMQCTTEENEVSFPSVKEFIEHEKSGHKIMPKVEAPTVSNTPKSADNPKSSTPVSEKKPIILQYKFEGIHDCGNEVDTLGIEVENSFYVIAYCNNCRVKIIDQRVIPIERQNVEFTKGKYIVKKG